MDKNNNFIIKAAKEFINKSNLNRLEQLGGIRIYDEPIVQFADAKDPLFAKLKDPQVISQEHFSPSEWITDAATVISYFLPFSQEVRQANRTEGMPATEWVYARIEGEACNNALRQELILQLNRLGGIALAPANDSRFAVVNNKSNWSERHVAYIAGLGTFGLNKSLLTERGCAGRYGSVVTNMQFNINKRPYDEVYQYCTWCGQCISRCPSGAISEDGKDIPTCANYIDNEIMPKFAPRYGCGKCQTDVLCENSCP